MVLAIHVLLLERDPDLLAILAHLALTIRAARQQLTSRYAYREIAVKCMKEDLTNQVVR